MKSITAEKGGQVKALGTTEGESGPSSRLPTERREEDFLCSFLNVTTLLPKIQISPWSDPVFTVALWSTALFNLLFGNAARLL